MYAGDKLISLFQASNNNMEINIPDSLHLQVCKIQGIDLLPLMMDENSEHYN